MNKKQLKKTLEMVGEEQGWQYNHTLCAFAETVIREGLGIDPSDFIPDRQAQAEQAAKEES